MLAEFTPTRDPLHALFEHSLDAMLLVRADGRLLRANRRACVLFGYSEAGFQAMGRSAIFDGTDPRVGAALAERERHGTAVSEFRCVRKGGERFLAQVASAAFVGPDGEPCISKIIRDISAERALQQALADSEARLRSLFSALSHGVVVQGADGAIQMCNAAAERILGLTAAQMMGRTWIDPRWHAIREDGAPFPGEAHPAMVALRTGHAVRDVVMGIHKPSGELTWISVSAEPLQRAGEALPHAVVVAFVDTTVRQQARNELAREAHTDALTGLANRSHFLQEAEREVRRSRRHGQPLAVLMIDIDHFKRINDAHGHAVGDRALQAFARTCVQVMREVDLIGRVGGEEFCALLPQTDASGARAAAERIRQAVEAQPVQAAPGVQLPMTVSVGVALLLSDEADFHALMVRADRALYAAKDAGRNCVVMAARAMRS
jgi:diguanylate cyclase (GGDEF)-like protein/PAS domain S-box-containing protein